MRLYSVIDFDLINSRKINNREKIQVELMNHLRELSWKYERDLVAPITCTLGDEWQIVVRDLAITYDLIWEVQKILMRYKLKAYFGVGLGQIVTNENHLDTRQMDGDAFIFARQALGATKLVKSNNKIYKTMIHNQKCKVLLLDRNYYYYHYIEDERFRDELSLTNLSLINNTIQNNEILMDKLTDLQLEVIELYEKYQNYNNIVQELNLNKANISKRLAAANYFQMENNRKIVKSLLTKYNINGG